MSRRKTTRFFAPLPVSAWKKTLLQFENHENRETPREILTKNNTSRATLILITEPTNVGQIALKRPASGWLRQQLATV